MFRFPRKYISQTVYVVNGIRYERLEDVPEKFRHLIKHDPLPSGTKQDPVGFGGFRIKKASDPSQMNGPKTVPNLFQAHPWLQRAIIIFVLIGAVYLWLV